MHRRVTHNHYFEQMDALLGALDQFHQELNSTPEQVRRLSTKWARLVSAQSAAAPARRYAAAYIRHKAEL